MTLPNKLTLGRMAMILVFIGLYLLKDVIGQPLLMYILGAIFVIASLTDFFDGYLARKHNIVTTFGKFMDPLADKLLVIAALMVLNELYALNGFSMTYWMPFWVVLIVVMRELLVTAIRLVAMDDGKVIAAGPLGKYKTFATMITITYYFFLMPLDTYIVQIIGIIMVAISVLLTLVSGFDYFIKNKSIITKSI